MLLSNRSSQILLVFSLFLFLFQKNSEAAKVVVIVPIEHEAMNKIISGIEEVLSQTGHEVIVKNAHGDSNIMLALIKQIQNDHEIKLIMPIGITSTQMVLANIKNKPIVAVATKRERSASDLYTGVNDEIPISISIQKLKILHKIAVIYSASEKVIPEINELKEYANSNGIALHLSMIQNLTDLSSAVKSAPEDIEAFIILKDHLVVSGISVIVKEALRRNIPLIASDEGSVINGATIAIGVPERDIGVEAGNIAKMILGGKKASDISYKNMDSLMLFINKDSFANQKLLTREMLTELGLQERLIEPASVND